MKRIVLAVLSLGVTHASTCGAYYPVPACAAFPRADAVFRGSVIDFQGADMRRAEVYRVAVKEIFKGLPPGTTEVFINPCDSSSYGGGYGEGEHLFFVSSRRWMSSRHQHAEPTAWAQIGNRKKFSDCFCSASRPLRQSDPDLAYLRGEKAATGWLLGKVVQNRHPLERTDSMKGTPGARIQIRRGERVVWATSDESGAYRFDGLAPGVYGVTAEKFGFPEARLVGLEGEVEVRAGGCSQAHVSLGTRNSISGTIVQADGKPLGNAEIYAGVVEGQRVTRLRWTHARTDMQGQFTISPVPAWERLVIGLNIAPPSPQAPLDAVYAPGTGDLGAAQVFELTPVEKVDGVRIQLPPPLPQAVLKEQKPN